MLQHEGKFEMPSTATSGINKNKKPYTQWKHKIGGRLFSSFKTVAELGLIDGDNYIIAYEESPNSAYPDNPYKNLKNVTPAVGKEEMKEEDKKVNMTNVGQIPEPQANDEPKATEEERWDKINAVKDKKIMFGQVTNLTIKWIMNERRTEQPNKPTLDKNFNPIFDHIWKLVEEKRKEKLK